VDSYREEWVGKVWILLNLYLTGGLILSRLGPRLPLRREVRLLVQGRHSALFISSELASAPGLWYEDGRVATLPPWWPLPLRPFLRHLIVRSHSCAERDVPFPSDPDLLLIYKRRSDHRELYKQFYRAAAARRRFRRPQQPGGYARRPVLETGLRVLDWVLTPNFCLPELRLPPPFSEHTGSDWLERGGTPSLGAYVQARPHERS